MLRLDGGKAVGQPCTIFFFSRQTRGKHRADDWVADGIRAWSIRHDDHDARVRVDGVARAVDGERVRREFFLHRGHRHGSLGAVGAGARQFLQLYCI